MPTAPEQTVTVPETAGTRVAVGFVGVDAGTMCLATSFPADDEWMDGDGEAWSGPGWVCSRTGYGDGSYDVLTVTATSGPWAGQLTGVEVAFLSPTIEAAAAAAVSAPAPSEDQRRDVWAGRADEQTVELYNAWLADDQRCLTAAWDRMVTDVDPATETQPTVVAALAVEGHVGAGDPCYGGPTQTIDLPAGTYTAVVWTNRGETCRLGLYRTS